MRSSIWQGRTPRIGICLLPDELMQEQLDERCRLRAFYRGRGPVPGECWIPPGAQRDVVAAWEHQVAPATVADRRSAVDLVRRWVMDGWKMCLPVSPRTSGRPELSALSDRHGPEFVIDMAGRRIHPL